MVKARRSLKIVDVPGLKALAFVNQNFYLTLTPETALSKSYPRTLLKSTLKYHFTNSEKLFFIGGKLARINIEDSLFTDGRFIQLCSKHGDVVSIGMMTLAFRLAQTYWLKERSLIPKATFLFRKDFQDLIDVGLAEENDDGIYVCGSKEQFDWIVTRVENGKKGGRPTLDKNNLKEPKPNLNQNIEPKTNLKEPKHNLNVTKEEPKPNLGEPKHNPLTLTQSLINTHTQKISENEIIAEFNKNCSGVGKLKSFNSFSLPREALLDFLNRTGDANWCAIEKWSGFFKVVAGSDYLSGKSKVGFVATLPWLLKPDNFENVLGGLYGNRLEDNNPKSGQKKEADEAKWARLEQEQMIENERLEKELEKDPDRKYKLEVNCAN